MAGAAHLESPRIRATYDTWADTYPSVAHNPLMRLEQEIVESILMTLRPRRALDVGTGSGRYLPILARAGAAKVIGADFSMAMLRSAARTATGSDPSIVFRPGKSGMGSDPGIVFRPGKSALGSDPSIISSPGKSTTGSDPCISSGPGKSAMGSDPLVCADARRLPFARRSFDLVNASLTVGDVVDLQAWTSEMARVLGRGGHLVYSDFHPSWTQHGWKRTFRDRDGETHELAFAAHSIEDHLAALDAAGLHPSAIREPRFRDDSDPAVKAFRRRWRNPPVVVVFHAVKQP
jgi:ubiquinone/menaquinone biosynthesis C-methylase UbiE